MRDCSLMVSPNRLARAGEELLVYRFPSGTKGLAARSNLELKVIPFPEVVSVGPGTRLLLRDIPEHLQCAIDVRPIEEVTFIQTTASAFRYRDAVHFQNGQVISLQRLQVGQRIRVLGLWLADRISEPELLATAG